MEKPVYLGEYANTRRNNLDFMRFFAAVIVIYWHSFTLGEGDTSGDFVSSLTNGKWNSGAFAVATFFVISGYLITQSYLNSKSLYKYTKARILRIFPGLAFALLFSVFVIGPIATSLSLKLYLLNHETIDYLKSIFLYRIRWNLPGTFDNNIYKGSVNGAIWTIPFEFLCYIIVAILGVLGLLKYKHTILLIFLLNFYYYIYMNVISPSGAGSFFGFQINTIVELFTYFSAGMVLCLYKDIVVLNKHFSMVCIIILFISLNYGGTKELFVIFGSYLLIYFAYLPIPRIHNFAKYGDFSYGVYIFAFPIQQLVTHFFNGSMNAYLNFIISLPITLILAYISWNLIEKNFMKLKKKKLIPININLRLTKYKEFYYKSVDFLFSKMSWKTFFVLFILFIISFTFYNSKPSEITFPYHKSNSIFSGNWLDQNSDEHYRWINKSASVNLSKSSKKNTLVIEGFIPESFNEINLISIYANDVKIKETALKKGAAIDITTELSQISNNFNLRLEFNDIHTPKKEDQDQRIMSGMISKIEIK